MNALIVMWLSTRRLINKMPRAPLDEVNRTRQTGPPATFLCGRSQEARWLARLIA